MKMKFMVTVLAGAMLLFGTSASAGTADGKVTVTASPGKNNLSDHVNGLNQYGKATLSSSGAAYLVVYYWCEDGTGTGEFGYNELPSGGTATYTIYMRAGCTYKASVQSMSSYTATATLQNYNN